MKCIQILLIGFLSFTISAQEPYLLSEEIDKTTSLTFSEVLDPGFDDFLVYRVREGTTILKQKDYLIKIGRESLEVGERILLSKGKGMKHVYAQRALSGQKFIYLPSYSINKDTKMIDFFCHKLNETLKPTKLPIKLFSGPAPSSKRNIRIIQNEANNLLTITYMEKLRKEKKQIYHCHVFDENLKEIYTSAIEKNLVGPNAEKKHDFRFLAWDNGIVFIEPKERNVLNIMDVRNSKLHKVNMASEKFHRIIQVMGIENGNLIVGGVRASEEDKRGEEAFSIEVNVKTDAVIRYNVQGLQDLKKNRYPFVSDVFIQKNGGVYFLTSDLFASSSTIKKHDFQVYYISSNGDTWKKDIPVPVQIKSGDATGRNLEDILPQRAFLNDDELCLLYNDTDKAQKMDANSFGFGENIGSVALVKPGGPISMLKIDQIGNVKRKSFDEAGVEIIGSRFSYNGPILYTSYSTTSGMTYDNSRILKVDFSKF